MYKLFIKNFFDVLFAMLGLIFISPLFIIISILLCVSNRGNPFFLQNRGGKKQKIFQVIKFKTMNDKRDKYGELLSDDKRLTKFGSFIRKFSLDELPQLINILKRDMSLIGPRPFISEYLVLYDDLQKE